MPNTPETSVVFRRAGGHSHNGLTSSLIDTTRYSLFDFSPNSIGGGGTARRRFQDNNKQLIKKFIIDTVEERVLNPQGIEIQANAITARNIVSNTITANELSANLVLVNNIIQSNNFSIAENTGWFIGSNGDAIFNNATLRGEIIANSGTIAGWVIDSSEIRTSNTTYGLRMQSYGAITAVNLTNPNDTYTVSLSSVGLSSYRVRNNTISKYEILQTQNRQDDFFANTSPINNNLEQTVVYTSQYISFAKRTNIAYLLSETAKIIHGADGNNPYGEVTVYKKDTANNILQRVTMNGYDGTLYASSGISTGGSVSASSAVYASNWFRSYGQTGWYNETYGGGIYMIDTTWVRTYASKSFYSDSEIRSGGDMRAGDNVRVSNGKTIIADTSFRLTGSSTTARMAQGDSPGFDVLGRPSSLRRLKENIVDIENALSILGSLRPRKYNFKVDAFSDIDPLTQEPWSDGAREFSKLDHKYGFIVEEIMETNPDLISYTFEPDDVDNPNYLDFSLWKPTMWEDIDVLVLCVKAIQELSQKIESIEARLNS